MPGEDSRPAIKDQQMYEALRRKGDSKEKAARISNAAANEGRTAVSTRGGELPAYEDWTVKDLQRRAKELDMTGYSKLHKDALIDKLRHH
ncbi:DUF7218 family protein [Tomitella biformata]|uniref:DUF7218 family protein n=1 Tax=Tomitella biformata TaxID=630403 RepID=UPI0004633FEB|nr:hypothetical protein [Tomitella biformata]